MIDSRAEKLVELVLDYSIRSKSGDRLFLQYSPSGRVYADIFDSLAKKRDMQVQHDNISFNPEVLRSFIENPSQESWKKELDRRNNLANWCNTRILIDCGLDSDYGDGIPDKNQLISKFNKEVIGPYKEILYRQGNFEGYQVRWNIVGFPSEDEAKKIGMSLEEYSDFVYSAALSPNWPEVGRKMQALKSFIDNSNELRIIVPDKTNLRLSLKGRGARICEGLHNMPDGEFFYGPVEDSVNGTVYFQHPSSRDVGIIQGINLKFVNGKIVEHDAKLNNEGLTAILDTDEGVKSIGELGIGVNYGIKKPVTNVLFDEKIGGTIHLALGSSFNELPFNEGGGLNKSAIHWDIVCDLRRDERNLSEFPGGVIEIDGKIVQENGEWKI